MLTNGCVCNLNVPCEHDDKTLMAFAICNNGTLSECEKTKPLWHRPKSKGTAIQRLLSVDTTAPVVNGTLWLISNLSVIIVCIFYFCSLKRF